MSADVVHGIECQIVELFDYWTNLHYDSECSADVHYYDGWCTIQLTKSDIEHHPCTASEMGCAVRTQ
jgi:hypothetical protein